MWLENLVLGVRTITRRDGMTERLQLEIINTDETPGMFWFVIRLTEGKLSFEDRFAWVKSKAWIYTGPPIPLPRDSDPPRRQDRPDLWEEREKNHFTYDEIVQTAVHEFLRVTGRIDPIAKAKGFTWPLYPFHLTRGNPALPLSLRQRASSMIGAQISLAQELPKEALQPPSPPGDVYTISTDWDATIMWEPDAWFMMTNWSLFIGYRFTGAPYQIDRMVCRFPLTALPGGVSIASVDFKNNCTFAGDAPATWDIHPYNGDGQANPATDSPATCAARILVGTPYLDDLIDWRTTGIKTMLLSSAANTDVENAKAAVNRFSLGGHQEDETLVENATLEQLEAAGTDEPKLIVTSITTPAGKTPNMGARMVGEGLI